MKVCGNCFNDLEIRNFIESNSKESSNCSYCDNPESKVIDLEELLDFFSEFIDIFIPDDELGQPILELINQDWEIFNPTTSSSSLLNDILNSIGSNIKNDTERVLYIEDINECVDYWEILKDDLKWRRRFLLDIDTIFGLGWDTFFDSIKEFSKDKILYRARIHKNENQYPYPLIEMGSPDKQYATNGRANPEGIPYLYLSENYETTLYETRVTYLDEVSVGSFRLIKDEEVKLVDFTNYTSPFLNMGDIVENAKSRLLQEKISIDLSRPIRRYDSHLEYLPTQFICEFIRYITGADGIVFDSSLHEGGINYVVFTEEKFECIAVDKYHVTSVNIEATHEKDFILDFSEF
tara:strand:+ start:4593 stop:5642 length:1050 start_codon:yes stop_codon:yes gene_type:complete